jgi:hypothetical protein
MAEVVAPAGIDWLPQTPGWYLVLAVVLVFVARRVLRTLRKWYRNRYRREALTRLRELETGPDDSIALAREANTLLKLTAMTACSRTEVASLTGGEWVAWLNGQCEGAVFDEQQAVVLAEGSYRALPVDEGARASLLAAMARWINEHRDLHA